MDEPELSPRRRVLLEAALTVLAEQGLRGLTHRAVDRQAGLPEGTCSAYLRTRSALLLALGVYVVDQLADDVEQLATDIGGGDEDVAIARTSELFSRWLERQDLMLARLELTIESSRTPELAAVVVASRHRLEDLVSDLMLRRGGSDARRRSTALVAAIDGLLVSALLLPAPQRQDFVAQTLPLVMHGLGPLVAADLPAPDGSGSQRSS